MASSARYATFVGGPARSLAAIVGVCIICGVSVGCSSKQVVRPGPSMPSAPRVMVPIGDDDFTRAVRLLGDSCLSPDEADTALQPGFHPLVQKTYALRLAPPMRLFLADPTRTVSPLRDLSTVADIEAARFRQAQSELVVIGPPASLGNGIPYDDWLTVFRAISSAGVLGVSIDPGPDTKGMQVRYLGGIEHTHVGDVLFEADRTMKVMSTGFDNQTRSKWENMPAAIQTELDLISADASTPMRGGWHRFWFMPSDEAVHTSANTVRIPDQRVVVKEESVPPGRPSPASAVEFASEISRNFLSLRDHVPSTEAGLI